MKKLNPFFVMIGFVTMLFVVTVGCKPTHSTTPPNNPPTTTMDQHNSTYEVIEINGHTYYRRYAGYAGMFAPTPETIKKCMREVIKEETENK